MTKRMLIDTTHAEETRVVVLDGNRLEDYDVETSTKKQLKGNIYLAKIVRIEPSLQAAFVEYGGNRHGFLAFSEIHPDYYQIPVADRERLIALQEEEARAEEARADRDDEGDEDEAPSQEPVRPERSERPERHERSRQRAPRPEAASGPIDPFGGDEQPAIAERQPDRETVEPEAPDHQASDADLIGSLPPADEPTIADAVPEAEALDEARADEDRSDDHDGSADMALAIPSDTIYGDEDGAAIEAYDGMAVEDAPADDGPIADDDQHPVEAREEQQDGQPDEPAPETVGGENASDDDGRAQRRTARFLRQYKIQEVMRRRQILLIQVVKEERGNKGAALTTYISLAGRFCVLMPNSLRGGGVSRKITSAADRRRLKEITNELEIPRGMGMIVRTAGAQRPRPEIRRDCEYLLRTWDDIRETTMQSIAPCLVYEEASLIKRAIRDVYTRDIEEIVVDGEPGWKGAREFMRTLMPSNAGKVNLWRDPAQKLFSHYQVEHHLDAMLQPTVQLRSGGYLVINQTEALVAIDVNSGRSTRERGIEETALRTNMEAADEVARQLRLRDLAGLIVIDFIDMEARRNNIMVEKRLKDALRNDRARIQVGSISHFGLMEMSRQRLRPSLAESSFVTCSHCGGSGFMRGIESSALHVLRAIEEEAGRRKAAEILVKVASPVALYVLNNKRSWLQEIEDRHHMVVQLAADDSLIPPALKIEKVRDYVAPPPMAAPVTRIPIEAAPPPDEVEEEADWDDAPVATPVAARPAVQGGSPNAAQEEAPASASSSGEGDAERRGKRRRRRRRGGRREDGSPMPEGSAQPGFEDDSEDGDAADRDEIPGEGDGIGGDIDTTPRSLQPGETLDSPSVFGTGSDEQPVAPIEATGEARRAGERGRRRRGGRNRPRPEQAGSESESGSEDELEPVIRAPIAYRGPTPADPFAGSYDIFEMIERDVDDSPALLPNPSASAASFAPVSVPEPETAPPAVPEPEPSLAPVQAVHDEAVAPSEPSDIAPETEPTPIAQPVAEAVAEPMLDMDAEPAAKPGKTPRPRKPRASRARKPPAASDETAQELPVALLDPFADTPPAAPAMPEALSEPALEPALEIAPAPTSEPASEPVPEPGPAAGTGRDPSIVQAVVIGDAPAPAARTGWWKR